MASASPRLPEDAFERVAHGERVELPELHAALVPLEDLRLLEEIEDAEDVRLAREALAEGGEPIPLEELKAELGIR